MLLIYSHNLLSQFILNFFCSPAMSSLKYLLSAIPTSYSLKKGGKKTKKLIPFFMISSGGAPTVCRGTI